MNLICLTEPLLLESFYLARIADFAKIAKPNENTSSKVEFKSAQFGTYTITIEFLSRINTLVLWVKFSLIKLILSVELFLFF